MEKNNIKVYRTIEGTIFEVAFLILAIIVWGLIIWFVNQAPDIVPTHFDASGNPNAWGSPIGIIFPCSIITISGAAMLILCYFPKSFNLSEKYKTPRNIVISIRMLRIYSLLMLLLTLAIAWTSLRSTSHSPIPIITIVAIMVIIGIVTTIATHRVK
jgi:uncharacterized membrane protein